MYYLSVHLIYASIVGAAALLLTAIRSASATTKYWIWGCDGTLFHHADRRGH
jgi:hypothetical protein